jgi:hypothetical protein
MNQAYEGGDPIDLTNTNLLKETPFHVAPKIDGIRYLLTVNENEHPFVVSRRGEKTFFPLPFHRCNLPKTICKSYVIDIEKVDRKYYILDVLNLDGIELKNRPFTERYEMLKTVFNLDLNSNFILLPYIPWFLSIKFADIVQNFPVDGLIFVASEKSIFHQKYRWKYVNTIDFQALRGDFLGVSVAKNKVVPFMIGKKEQRFNDYPLKINAIYECRFDLKERKWKVVCRRHDKIKPNGVKIARFIFYEVILKQYNIQPFVL